MPLLFIDNTCQAEFSFFERRIAATFGNPEKFRSLHVLKTSARVTIPALELSSFAVNAQAAEQAG
jgi:hypothetical protein